ncbi:uncharacterized protein K444DRAFT_185930 [Hyaloscypha bicolor E]|uniref:Uncharacterized protein n=1 Tax=Hyaloscypha bicolor E TaxID=1095630 RepID=A0A2J6TRT8_9HELO|nr:uncharacterized protein K444DRAFT_185930 [Hyaloscypha bicolor E]PMD65736.1 hypothetical protein K444DRAFT_185930 [Hyaloscypha bicolor E]
MSRVLTIGIFNSDEFSAADSKTVAGSITKPIFYVLGRSVPESGFHKTSLGCCVGSSGRRR